MKTPDSSIVRHSVVSCLAFWLLWFAFVGTLDRLELAVGAAAALAGTATAAAALARGRFPPLPGSVRSWRRALRQLPRIPADLARLLVAHGRGGDVRDSSLPSGTDWRRHSERGLAGLLGSLAPNTIVLDVAPDGNARVHELRRAGTGPL